MQTQIDIKELKEKTLDKIEQDRLDEGYPERYDEWRDNKLTK